MTRRLFVSVDLDGLTDEIATVQDLFADTGGLNFVDPRQAHVTLKFLGDTDEDRIRGLVSELETAVERSEIGPFEVEFGGLGVFPDLDSISVVWLGTTVGGDELTELHESIEQRTVEMGFEAEDHEFTPHVTLARMRRAGGKELVQDVVKTRDPSVGTLSVEAVHLTESVLTDGPAYSTLETVTL